MTAFNIKDLNEEILVNILSNFTLKDFLNLSSTCKTLYSVDYESLGVYRQFYAELFTDPWSMLEILEEVQILTTADGEDEDDHASVLSILKTLLSSPADDMLRFAHLKVLVSEDELEALEACRKQVLDFENTNSFNLIEHSILNLFKILIDNPLTESEVCYQLASILVILNEFEASRQIIDLYLGDNEYIEPRFQHILNTIEEMEDENQELYNNNLLSNIDPPELSPTLMTLLVQLFDRFDSDNDGKWSYKDFANYVELVNGFRPPKNIFESMCAKFNDPLDGLTEEMKALKKKVRRAPDTEYLRFSGLSRFYLEQCVQAPEETRGDLQKLGYDLNSMLCHK
jgi:hypothetical protein